MRVRLYRRIQAVPFQHVPGRSSGRLGRAVWRPVASRATRRWRGLAPDDLIAKGRRTGREGEAEGAKPGRIGGGTNDGGNLLTLAPGGSTPAYVRPHGPVFGAAFFLLLSPTGNTWAAPLARPARGARQNERPAKEYSFPCHFAPGTDRVQWPHPRVRASWVSQR
jgi:hypothetical protein